MQKSYQIYTQLIHRKEIRTKLTDRSRQFNRWFFLPMPANLIFILLMELNVTLLLTCKTTSIPGIYQGKN